MNDVSSSTCADKDYIIGLVCSSDSMDSNLCVANITFQQKRLAADHAVHQEAVFHKIQHLVRHVEWGWDALLSCGVCDTLWRQHGTVCYFYIHSLKPWITTPTAAAQHYFVFPPTDSAVINPPGNENHRSLIRIMFRKRGGEWRQPTEICLSSDRGTDENTGTYETPYAADMLSNTDVCLLVPQQMAAGKYSPLRVEALGLDGCMCTIAGFLYWPHGIDHWMLSPPGP